VAAALSSVRLRKYGYIGAVRGGAGRVGEQIVDCME
jgi:hypothetical protein